jgi:hypothetical protein
VCHETNRTEGRGQGTLAPPSQACKTEVIENLAIPKGRRRIDCRGSTVQPRTRARRARAACLPVRVPGLGKRYTAAVGLLVARKHAFDPGKTLATFEAAADEVLIELPRDLRQIADWPRARLDGDQYQHRVALALAGGGYELLEHVCVDDACGCGRAGNPGSAVRGHARPGHHSWGDSGHEADDLAYSLLCARYGGVFRPGWRAADPPLPALLFPGLFDVIAQLSRGHSWRMQWDHLRSITTERSDASSEV